MVVAIMVVYPDTLHHPDNYCYVSRYVTPQHIVPEWYFLPFYSMLRACSIKGVGVLLLVVCILLYAVCCMGCGEGHASTSATSCMAIGPHTSHCGCSSTAGIPADGYMDIPVLVLEG